MTTDKTPATLATAKHGGCVQLRDWLPPLPAPAHEPVFECGPAYFDASQMRDYARTALSAQPSPGGQGEVCIPLPTPGKGEWSDGWNACREAMLRGEGEALAARQPIGAPVVSDLSGYAVAASQVRRGYDVECDRCGKFCDEGPGPCQPAQAVDLRAVRDAVQGITLGFDGDLPYIKGIAEALALIDSQAVGNG